MDGLIVILVLAVLAVPVLLVVAFVMVLGLRSRVTELEAQVSRLWRAHLAMAQHEAVSPLHGTPVSMSPEPGAVHEPWPVAPAGQATADEPTLADYMRTQGATSAAPPLTPEPAPPRVEVPGTPPPFPPRPSRSARPDVVDTAVRAVRRWFTEGNVPVKVGVLVLLAGVAALLKYASDQGYLQLPVGLRLSGIALAAVGGLVFGWRQRESRRSFALAVQGGAVGVLLLVVFAAFRLYDLVPAGTAFGASVALVAGLCVLAVRQEALVLAVFGTLAGFFAPIWLSTGQGDHVALFGYYALLNAGIVAMAWRRPWRLLNVLGFACTFGIGTAWGVLRYRPEDFATTEPFLVLFFAMYLALPLLYAARRRPAQRRVLDGCLVFGTPLVAFALQAGLLDGAHMPLAFCALGVAALHAALAAVLRGRPGFEALVAPYAVIAVGFATLAVPLAVSAQATGAIFALEGAGLVWLGLRQQRRFPLLTGAALQVAAAVALVVADPVATGAPAVLNGPFMAAALIALSGLATAAVLQRAARTLPALVAYLWGLGWWLGTGLHEIGRGVPLENRVDVVMVFVLATGGLAAAAWRRLPARALSLTAAAALAAPLLFVFAQVAEHEHPFVGTGLLAWIVHGIVGAFALRALRGADGGERGVAHAAWWFGGAVALAFVLEAFAARAGLGQGWRYAAVALPWLVLGATLWRRPHAVAFPIGAAFEAGRTRFAHVMAFALAALFAAGCVLPGSMAPLPHVPVVGPLELAQLVGLGLALALARVAVADTVLRRVAAGACFLLATMIVLRAVHHWGGVPWNDGMFSTGLVQTSLTVLWSVVGMAAWVIGSRGGRRDVWQAGAVLMAVVLCKLVLVDRQYLGNLLGIGSFLAFGLLCTAVGYLAPVPPRREPAGGLA